MKKINVSTFVSFGYECTGRSHDSSQSATYEISDHCWGVLRNEELNKGDELDLEDIQRLADKDSDVASFLDDIERTTNEMKIEFWLERCPDQSNLYEHLAEDIESKAFVPSVSYDDYKSDYMKDNGITPEDYEEDDLKEEYYDEIFEEYIGWVDGLDLYERAEKYGLDIDACNDTGDVNAAIDTAEL